jgi:hypothetical protein
VAVDAALEAAEPKAALVALLLESALAAGSAAGPLQALSAGGEAAAAIVETVLAHGLDVLDGLAMVAPRRGRRGALQALAGRVEAAVDAYGTASHGGW